MLYIHTVNNEGSSPSVSISVVKLFFWESSSMVERQAFNLLVASSNLAFLTC